MSTHECVGCREYQELSRRHFLQISGGAAALAVTSHAWLPRVAYADWGLGGRDVIVHIFLRGGADGLTLCVPHGENAYYSARPTLAVPRPDSGDPNSAIDLDGFFGLPPAMAPLLDAYDAGHLLVVHACGLTGASRSHFDAQRFMEVGALNNNLLTTGWLGRHLLSSAPLTPGAVMRAVGIGYGLQRVLVGAPQTLPIPNLDNFGITGNSGTLAERRAAIDDMYASVGDPVRAAAQNTLLTIDLLNQINFAGYVPAGGAVYPDSAFGYSLKSTAALIRAQVGVEAISIDLGGWDTHNNQGPTAGDMAGLMTQLASGLAAFHTDIFTDGRTNVTAVVMSEFGRRLAQNGSIGTDHGYANCMFLLGQAVTGGRVLTQWPGLNPGQLFEGRDLAMTIDYRDVLGEVVSERLGNPNLPEIFPGFTPTIRGVTRSVEALQKA